MTTEPKKILYAKPSITEKEISYVHDAIAHGWGETCYDWLDRFERNFAAYAGVEHAMATSSATGALHLGLAALGIGPGDEVILADTNWVASVAPVVHLGAIPKFVDILPDTWCIDTDAVKNAISPRTKAIIAVHLYGNLCDMDRLEEIATEYGISLIEDAAEAIGSGWGNKVAGSRGIFGIFSFHGTKTVTTGEGGMLVSNNQKLMDKARMLNNHGRLSADRRQFWAHDVGYKFKMSNIQAALGCAQLERIEELISRRRKIFNFYLEALRDVAALNPLPRAGENYGYWMPTVVYKNKGQGLAMRTLEAFKKANIDGRAFFPPLSSQAGFSRRNNQNSYDLPERAVNLPSYHDMANEDQERVIDIVIDIAK